jgi:hypothetical protein
LLEVRKSLMNYLQVRVMQLLQLGEEFHGNTVML